MPTLSLFEVVGPIMIGPSSSHTAGAARIGWLAHMIAGSTPRSIVLRFRDSLMNTYSGHATDRGLVAGLLGHREYDESVRTSLDDAERKRIPVRVERLETEGHPNEMVCSIVTEDGRSWEISGISLGGGSINIVSVNNLPVSIDGSTSGYLIYHAGNSLTGGQLSLLASHGHWVDLAVTSIAPGVTEKDRPALPRGITFVPGREPMNSEAEHELRCSVLRDRPDGFVRWIPAIYRNLQKPTERIALFRSAAEAIALADSGSTLADVCVEYEAGLTGLIPEDIRKMMRDQAEVMWESMAIGLETPLVLVGGFTSGEDGKKLWAHSSGPKALTGTVFGRAMARAISVAEVNGSMGRVVAAPTAGACGILPGVVYSIAERLGASQDEIVDALIVAAGVGATIGQVASFSGAVGGCQAEIGVASSMSAAAATYLAGGTPHQVFNAAALALKNILGLACDPAAGPVEVPCIKRNAIGVANALSAAEMSLAGVDSVIPFDEVVLALKNVQDLLPEDLRDNTLGGLGSTPTAAKMKLAWAVKCKGGCRC